MVIEVNPRVLTQMFGDFVKNSKVMFNFKTNGRYLEIQMLGDYTVTTSFDVKSLDGDYTEQDITVWVTKCVHILNKDEYIRITITDAQMLIEQSVFSCVMLREYESRRSFPDISGIQLLDAQAERLRALMAMSMAGLGMAKELSISPPDPMFVRGNMYMYYHQAAIVASINYPEISIPFSTLRDFVGKLDKHATYAYLKQEEVMYFHSECYDFWIPVINYNINAEVVNNLDKRLLEASTITKVSFNGYKEKLLTIADTFPKQQVNMGLGSGNFIVNVSTNSHNVSIGNAIGDSGIAFNITSAQLASIAKLFGEEEITVKKGVRCICLSSVQKTLILAGVTY